MCSGVAAPAESAAGAVGGLDDAAGAGGADAAPPGSVPSSMVIHVRAISDYMSEEDGDLRFSDNDIIRVLDTVDPDWWVGKFGVNRPFGAAGKRVCLLHSSRLSLAGELNGEVGVIPRNYVESVGCIRTKTRNG